MADDHSLIRAAGLGLDDALFIRACGRDLGGQDILAELIDDFAATLWTSRGSRLQTLDFPSILSDLKNRETRSGRRLGAARIPRLWRSALKLAYLTIASALITSSLVTVARADDDCEDAGKLGVMLGQIDKQCAKYELTGVGRVVMSKMAEKVAPIGGEQCAEKGKVAMLQQISEMNPEMDAIAASGNQKAFNTALCNAIASYLSLLGDPKMVRLRK